MLIKEIKSLKTAQNVTLKAKLIKIDVNQSKKQTDYSAFTLQDCSGSLLARKWDTDYIGVWKENDVVEVSLQVSFYGDNNDKISFVVTSGKKLENENPGDYDNSFTPDARKMKDYLDAVIAEIYALNPAMKAVINPLFTDIDKDGSFYKVPAGKTMHHDGKSGLLYHTTSILHHVSKLADSAEECYGEKVDRALLYTAVILHDFFKTKEYKLNNVDRADVTKYALTGHIGEALKYLGWLEYTGAINKELSLQLSHIIEAHHGKLEWGSPVVPMTIEAFIMFTSDFFDSRMYMFKAEYKRLNDGELSEQYNKGLEAYVYRPEQY